MYDGPCLAVRPIPVPELPDIVVYLEALEKRILGQKLECARREPFFAAHRRAAAQQRRRQNRPSIAQNG
jgi:hypothetical protein